MLVKANISGPQKNGEEKNKILIKNGPTKQSYKMVTYLSISSSKIANWTWLNLSKISPRLRPLRYEAGSFDISFNSEMASSVTFITGPQSKSSLGSKEWRCQGCGTKKKE